MLVHLQERGFFLECGAYDGEKQSNTLRLERVRHRTGLLVEADPENFRQLMSKHRKAYTVNACLNTNPYPANVSTCSLGFGCISALSNEKLSVQALLKRNGKCPFGRQDLDIQ